MDNLLSELKRRHIFRVAAAYAVVAWVLLQLVANVSPILDLPPWIGRTVLLLLVIGFPVALLFAWIHQLAPTDVAPAPPDGAPAPTTIGRLDWALMGALVVVILLVSYQQIAPATGNRTAQVAQQTTVAAAREASLSPAGAISIAVLPFANLSSDPEQAFFSDGMTEEITAALAKIPDLRLVARGSAFQFRDEKRDRRAVAQALGATHLIEGSVRREGDRVRIMAQLIEADRGVNVWTESYDRQLASVFATQEDIATSIAGALRMPLGLRPGQQLVSSRNIDPESYQQYLRAKALYQGRVGGGGSAAGLKALNDAIALLDQVVARNPNYAPAWALLANVHDTAPNYSGLLGSPTASLEVRRQVVQASLSKAEPAARKAIQLDPNLAEGYRTLAGIQGRAGELLLEEELRSKALSLDPNDPGSLAAYSGFLARVGRVKEALAVQQQVQELEPFIPIVNRDMAVVLWLNGQDQAANAILRRIGNVGLIAPIQAAAGRYNEAADAMSSAPLPQGHAPETLQEAVRLLRMAPAPVASPQNVKRLGVFDFVYLYVGAPEQALRPFEVNLEAGWTNFANRLLSLPAYGPARKTERYKAYARKAGLVDYWRAKGWPEFCRPVGADDFVCD